LHPASLQKSSNGANINTPCDWGNTDARIDLQ
jgi:hypothetical protein